LIRVAQLTIGFELNLHKNVAQVELWRELHKILIQSSRAKKFVTHVDLSTLVRDISYGMVRF